MNQLTYINGGNAAYIDSLYEQFHTDLDAVDFGLNNFKEQGLFEMYK